MVAPKSVYRRVRRRYSFPMSGEYQLMLMIAVMHLLVLIGVGVLIYLALRHDPGHQRHPGESGPDRRRAVASAATRARHAALEPQPWIRPIMAGWLPAASSLISSVIAVCSVPSMLRTRASTALISRNNSSARTIPTR